MTALQINTHDPDFTRYFDIPETRFRLDHRTLLTAAAVTAAFAALGAYFATQKVHQEAAMIFTPEDPVVLQSVELTPPDPPPPTVEPPRAASTQPQPTPLRPVEQVFAATTPTLDLRPVPDPVETIGPVAPTIETPTATPEPSTPVVPPRLKVVTQPDWLRRPTAAEVEAFFPDRAMRLDRQGSAMLSCTVTEAGGLTGCQVASETPTGLGFGRAALEMSSLFRMRPQTADGQAVGGARVNVPVNFRLQ